jgi:uncharacterized protein (TIGR00369 family)
MTSPRDPDFERRVRESFVRQKFMATLGATLDVVRAGEIHIAFSHREDLTQQHGYLHAGVLASVADSACGYAALTLMPPGAAVLTVEFKVNLMAPAAGEAFVARGRVVRAGRTLIATAGDVFAVDGGRETHVLTMLGTVMTVKNRSGLSD